MFLVSRCRVLSRMNTRAQSILLHFRLMVRHLHQAEQTAKCYCGIFRPKQKSILSSISSRSTQNLTVLDTEGMRRCFLSHFPMTVKRLCLEMPPGSCCFGIFPRLTLILVRASSHSPLPMPHRAIPKQVRRQRLARHKQSRNPK